MRLNFIKMQALGNDFIVIDYRNEEAKALSSSTIKHLCNYKLGIGCDQLIVLLPSKEADVLLKIYNANGGQAEICGNGIRCIAKYIGKPEASFELTTDRIIYTESFTDGTVSVNMGTPQYEWYQIPLNEELESLYLNFPKAGFSLGSCVNIGNPHLVFFTNDLENLPIEEVGPYFENHKYFPKGVNVNFAHVISRDTINLRVWERGTGETLACGSGACAVHAIANRLGFVKDDVSVNLPGGTLQISKIKQNIFMRGDANTVFTGSIDITDK